MGREQDNMIARAAAAAGNPALVQQARPQGPQMVQPVFLHSPEMAIAEFVKAGVLTPEQAFNLAFNQQKPEMFDPRLKQLYEIESRTLLVKTIRESNEVNVEMQDKGWMRSAGSPAEAKNGEIAVQIPDDIIPVEEPAPQAVEETIIAAS